MPNYTQYVVLKKQIESFEKLGFEAELRVNNHNPEINLHRGCREYTLVDCDWSTASIQLAKLYGVFINEKRPTHQHF